MMSKMLNDLMNICDLESTDKEVGWRRRREAVKLWINKYIHTVDTTIGTVNSAVINSSTMDLIKEALAARLAEDLTTYTTYIIDKNKISAKLTVIKEIGEKK
jgi:hypothetical protein